MQANNLEPLAVRDEIAFWSKLSRHFYKAFDLERNPGPQYFLINTLLDSDAPLSVGGLISALQLYGALGLNGISDVSSMLEDLRKLGYVKLFHHRRDGQPFELVVMKDNRYLPTSATVHLEPKIAIARAQYIYLVLEELFGRTYAEAHRNEDELLMRYIFKFIVEKYLPNWTALLRELSAKAVITDKKHSRGVINKKLVASTEYFVLLHCLWDVALESGPDTAVTSSRLKALAGFVRPIKDSKFSSCLRLLKEARLVLEERRSVRLNPELLDAFREYASQLTTMRSMLKERLSRP
ncbi:MAG TPA: hypothetical protein VMU25_01815 [Candidatus Paceibacterota bacterium]|nr:hypothetical protein [Candidatus Paceibacterota bacterium]